jgi:hypothetical protein
VGRAYFAILNLLCEGTYDLQCSAGEFKDLGDPLFPISETNVRKCDTGKLIWKTERTTGFSASPEFLSS